MAPPVTSLEVVLELTLTEPVTGSLKREQGAPVEFSGWLGLHSALEQICGEAAGAGADESR